MKITAQLYRSSLFFLLSYGLLYFTYKWVNPLEVNPDFFAYYPMIQHPFHYGVSQSPWVYRQLTTLIAHVIWRLHIYYPLAIQFHDSHYDQRIFFAQILTNYLGVLIAAVLSAALIDRWSKGSSFILPVFAGLLCYFNFFLQDTTINGGADGMSWALLAACYLLYKLEKPYLFGAVLSLSVIQREILPVFFMVFSFVALARIWREHRTGARFQLTVFSWSLLVLIVYFVIRMIVRAPGNEYQVNEHAQLQGLMGFHLSRTYVTEVLLGQNLLIVALGLWLAVYLRLRQIDKDILPLLLVCLVLLIVSAMTNIGNNAGRILALTTPVVAIEIVKAMVMLDGKTKQSFYQP